MVGSIGIWRLEIELKGGEAERTCQPPHERSAARRTRASQQKWRPNTQTAKVNKKDEDAHSDMLGCVVAHQSNSSGGGRRCGLRPVALRLRPARSSRFVRQTTFGSTTLLCQTEATMDTTDKSLWTCACVWLVACALVCALKNKDRNVATPQRRAKDHVLKMLMQQSHRALRFSSKEPKRFQPISRVQRFRANLLFVPFNTISCDKSCVSHFAL